MSIPLKSIFYIANRLAFVSETIVGVVKQLHSFLLVRTHQQNQIAFAESLKTYFMEPSEAKGTGHLSHLILPQIHHNYHSPADVEQSNIAIFSHAEPFHSTFQHHLPQNLTFFAVMDEHRYLLLFLASLLQKEIGIVEGDGGVKDALTAGDCSGGYLVKGRNHLMVGDSEYGCFRRVWGFGLHFHGCWQYL